MLLLSQFTAIVKLRGGMLDATCGTDDLQADFTERRGHFDELARKRMTVDKMAADAEGGGFGKEHFLESGFVFGFAKYCY